jgi:hypothetical protein
MQYKRVKEREQQIGQIKEDLSVLLKPWEQCPISFAFRNRKSRLYRPVFFQGTR